LNILTVKTGDMCGEFLTGNQNPMTGTRTSTSAALLTVNPPTVSLDLQRAREALAVAESLAVSRDSGSAAVSPEQMENFLRLRARLTQTRSR
jgi:hypothetical protein